MKLKTHKATVKKIKVTGSKRHKKFTTKHVGQDHFNARQTGKMKRNKRRTQSMAKPDMKTASRLMPYL